MPKRTNEFQDLIHLLEGQLVPAGAKIYASHLMKDAVSGVDREVDIVIEHKSGIHPIRIGIEVIAHKRRASSTWIEGISAKHRDLPIDKSIAVSKSGFYKPAIEKAEALKIDALTLGEASNLDWPSKLDAIPHIRFESFLRPYLTAATLIFALEDSLTQFQGADLPNVSLFTPTEQRRGTVAEVLDRLLSDEKLVSEAEEKAYTDAGTVLDGELRLEQGSYAELPDGSRHLLHGIRFQAKCRKDVSEATLDKGRYRDIAVVLGSATSMGHDVQIVLSQRPEEDSPKVGLRIKKQKKR
jgi:hypothetical protein